MTNPNDDRELDDREAIDEIMEAFDLEEEEARDLWERFQDTVRKMSQVKR